MKQPDMKVGKVNAPDRGALASAQVRAFARGSLPKQTIDYHVLAANMKAPCPHRESIARFLETALRDK